MLRNGMLLLIMSVILFSGDYALSSAGGPKVYLPENVYRFGRVVEGMEVVYDFVIRNQGDEPLLIVDIESHCGCTAATPVERIAPGEEGVIQVNFNSEGYGGQEVKETVNVHTNDPNRPVFDLLVTGKVVRFVEIRPQHVLLNGPAGTPLAIDVEIRPNEEYPFAITAVQSERDDLIRCELIERCATGDKTRCLLRVHNLKASKGRYAEIITVHTNSEVRPSFPIFVVGRVR